MSTLDRNAATPKRLLRNAQRTKAGGIMGTLKFLVAGGLKLVGDALSIKLDPASTGLSLSSSGLKHTAPVTTKGDLFSYSTVPARTPVGANGTVLTASSGAPTGLLWSDNLTLNQAQIGDVAGGNFFQCLFEASSSPDNLPRTTLSFEDSSLGFVGRLSWNHSTNTFEFIDDVGSGINLVPSTQVLFVAQDGITPPFQVDMAANRVRLNLPAGTDDGTSALLQVNGTVSIAAGSVVLNGGTQVLGARQAAVADAVAGTVVAQLNALLARLRTHGLIAP